MNESMIFPYIILPLLIFFARIVDQSIGILRIIFATRGMKLLSFIFGFFESLIWLIAISQIITRLDNLICIIAFPLGYATGNVAGIYLEKKISVGYVMVRVVFQKSSADVTRMLRRMGFRITLIDAEGMDGPVKVLFSVIRRNRLRQFIRIVRRKNPAAFYTIEDVRTVHSEFFMNRKSLMRANPVRK